MGSGRWFGFSRGMILTRIACFILFILCQQVTDAMKKELLCNKIKLIQIINNTIFFKQD